MVYTKAWFLWWLLILSLSAKVADQGKIKIEVGWDSLAINESHLNDNWHAITAFCLLHFATCLSQKKGGKGGLTVGSHSNVLLWLKSDAPNKRDLIYNTDIACQEIKFILE